MLRRRGLPDWPSTAQADKGKGPVQGHMARRTQENGVQDLVASSQARLVPQHQAASVIRLEHQAPDHTPSLPRGLELHAPLGPLE